MNLKGSKRLPQLRNAIIAAALLFTSVSIGSQKSNADPLPATPDYEVKLFMSTSASLNSSNDLKDSVRTYFGMPSTKDKMSIQYLDTDDLALNNAGWNARVRKMEKFSDDEFELTYKKRYPIVNGDIDAALATAALDGFDATEDDYEAQVDWGYSKQTLSFSNKKDITKNGYSGMDLLSKTDSINELIDNAPGKFENWSATNWGTDQLEDAHKYGPVNAKRWTGTWQGLKIYIEVWEIVEEDGTGYDRIVEASFKTPSRTQAASLKTQLQSELTTKGWFSATDELKTQMILDRY